MVKKAVSLHKRLKGKIKILPTLKVSRKNFHLLYTPGVAEVAREIAKDPQKAFELTSKGNNVAIITDGSRTLGVGDTIAEASLPVMEGKALFLAQWVGVNAFPLCLNTRETKEIVRTCEILSPLFSLFNIEDITWPRSLEIGEEFQKRNFIFFHDDQQGVAIVLLAALLNALRVLSPKKIFSQWQKRIKICIAGAGAAGYGIFKILDHFGFRNIIVVDRDGIVFKGRKGNNKFLEEIAQKTNRENLRGGIKEAIAGARVFIGVSTKGGLINSSHIQLMEKFPIVFALSNPDPEIVPREIEKVTKDYIFGSGRPDLPNQINNILVFPGILKGLLLRRRVLDLNLEIKIALEIASLIKRPKKNLILPSPFNKEVTEKIIDVIKNYD